LIPINRLRSFWLLFWMFQRKYHMNLKFYQITNVNDDIQKYSLYNINKPYTIQGVYFGYNEPVYFGYYRQYWYNFKFLWKKTFNILISSMLINAFLVFLWNNLIIKCLMYIMIFIWKLHTYTACHFVSSIYICRFLINIVLFECQFNNILLATLVPCSQIKIY
jgi:hypothetical protein